MSDLPFFSGGGTGGGGGTGVTSYDALTNKPVTNLSGSPIIISTLDTGVYNIDGTWAMTSDDPARETLKLVFALVKFRHSLCLLLEAQRISRFLRLQLRMTSLLNWLETFNLCMRETISMQI